MAMKYKLSHSLIAWSPTVEESHTCFRKGLVDEYESIDFNPTPYSPPTLPTCLNFRSVLFDGV
jgi:hypothetical protein